MSTPITHSDNTTRKLQARLREILAFTQDGGAVGHIWVGGVPLASFIRRMAMAEDTDTGVCQGSLEAYFANSAAYRKLLAETCVSLSLLSRGKANCDFILPKVTLHEAKVQDSLRDSDLVASFTWVVA